MRRHGAVSTPMYPRGENSFWADDPQLRTFGLQFSRGSDGRVTDASSGPLWFIGDRYTGQRSFSYPAAWSSYTGKYESIDANGYYWALHVYELKGKLYADGDELVPLRAREFHVGSQLWQPAWLRFDEPLDGKTQIVRLPGQTLYRTNPY